MVPTTYDRLYRKVDLTFADTQDVPDKDLVDAEIFHAHLGVVHAVIYKLLGHERLVDADGHEPAEVREDVPVHELAHGIVKAECWSTLFSNITEF